MSNLLNSSEIIDFALHIEQDGYAFYVETAKKFNAPKLMDLFHYLAEEELKHEKTFKDLKKEVGTSTPPESYPGEYKSYMEDYLKSIAPRSSDDLRKLVSGLETVDEAIDMAIGFEKDSVVFYVALKKVVNKKHQEILDTIIQEEVKHILSLYGFKAGNIPAAPDVDSL